MMTTLLKHEPTGRLLELLVSLTIGIGTAGIVLTRGLLLWPFVPLNDFLLRILPPHNRLNVASEIALLATDGLYATFVYAFIRLSRRTSLTRSFLRSGAAPVIFAIPITCWVGMVPGYPPLVYFLFVVETALCIFSVYYLLKRFGTPRWHLVFIVSIHYVLWIWLFRRDIPSGPGLLIPGAAAVSSAVWIRTTRMAKNNAGTDGTDD